MLYHQVHIQTLLNTIGFALLRYQYFIILEHFFVLSFFPCVTYQYCILIEHVYCTRIWIIKQGIHFLSYLNPVASLRTIVHHKYLTFFGQPSLNQQSWSLVHQG
jgi:hypothetical protein